MTRDQLESVIRAAAAITNERSFVVVGSQAVLLPHPDAIETLEQRNRQLDPARPVESIVAWARRRAEEAQA